MTCKLAHSDQRPEDGIHTPISYEYADAAARTGASGFDVYDLGKFAWQQDNDTIWVLTATTPTWVAISGSAAASKAILTWGDDSIATSMTTRYLTPGFDDGQAETTETAFRIPFACTLKNLRIRARVAGSGAATLTYTLVVNGTPSSLTVSMSNTSQDGSDLVNTVAVSAGDLISIRVTKSASLSSSPDDVMASLEAAA